LRVGMRVSAYTWVIGSSGGSQNYANSDNFRISRVELENTGGEPGIDQNGLIVACTNRVQ